MADLFEEFRYQPALAELSPEYTIHHSQVKLWLLSVLPLADEYERHFWLETSLCQITALGTGCPRSSLC